MADVLAKEAPPTENTGAVAMDTADAAAASITTRAPPADGRRTIWTGRLIAKGDLVVLYESHRSMKFFYVEPGKEEHNRFGHFPHAAMVGKPYGSKMQSSRGNGGFVWLLSPTPELWTASLSHRTQILYIADISMICLQLELGPGAVVVEAGTGSGSLSHAPRT